MSLRLQLLAGRPADARPAVDGLPLRSARWKPRCAAVSSSRCSVARATVAAALEEQGAALCSAAAMRGAAASAPRSTRPRSREPSSTACATTVERRGRCGNTDRPGAGRGCRASPVRRRLRAVSLSVRRGRGSRPRVSTTARANAVRRSRRARDRAAGRQRRALVAARTRRHPARFARRRRSPEPFEPSEVYDARVIGAWQETATGYALEVRVPLNLDRPGAWRRRHRRRSQAAPITPSSSRRPGTTTTRRAGPVHLSARRAESAARPVRSRAGGGSACSTATAGCSLDGRRCRAASDGPRAPRARRRPVSLAAATRRPAVPRGAAARAAWPTPRRGERSRARRRRRGTAAGRTARRSSPRPCRSWGRRACGRRAARAGQRSDPDADEPCARAPDDVHAARDRRRRSRACSATRPGCRCACAGSRTRPRRRSARAARFARGMPGALASDELGALARSFAQLLERLREHTEYLRTLASKLSHELRTPLAVVTTSLDNLEHEVKAPYGRGSTSSGCAQGAKRLDAILAAMSEATQLEQAIQRNGRRSPFDLTAVVESCCNGVSRRVSASARSRVVARAAATATVRLGRARGAAARQARRQRRELQPARQPHRRRDRRCRRRAACCPSRTAVPRCRPRCAAGCSIRSCRFASSATAPPHLGLGLHIVALVADFHGGRCEADDLPDGSGVVFRVWFPGASTVR